MNLQHFLAKAHCYLFGHRRGKRISSERLVSAFPKVTYACPRCGAQWARTRKTKVKA